MKARLVEALRVMGHVHSQILLALVFFGFVTPYAVVSRLLSRPAREHGWHPIPPGDGTLQALRRSF